MKLCSGWSSAPSETAHRVMLSSLRSSHKTAEERILEDELSMRMDAARRRQRASLALQF